MTTTPSYVSTGFALRISEGSRSWWAYPGYVFFFLLLFVPGAYQPIKAAVLAVVFACGAVQFMRNGASLELDKRVVWWTWLFVLTGLAFVLRGVVRGAPGALPVSTVYVLWPMLYLALTALASRLWVIRGLMRCAVAALVAISVYSWSFILVEIGAVPGFLYVPLDQRPALEFYVGFVEYNLDSITSFFFLIPFVLSALLVWPSDMRTKHAGRRSTVDEPAAALTQSQAISQSLVPRKWLWTALCSSVFLVLLSGRRALWLVVGLAPLITIALQALLPSRKLGITLKLTFRAVLILIGLTAGGFAYLQTTYGLDAKAMGIMFMDGFDFAEDVGAGIRTNQFSLFVEGWMEEPVLGHGFGTGVDLVRADDAPWAGYELFYVHLLFQTGILGFGVYACGLVWIYVRSIQIIRAGNVLSYYMIPVLTGTTGFLIAAGTNPYLGTSGYMWILFWPLALINIRFRYPAAGQPVRPSV